MISRKKRNCSLIFFLISLSILLSFSSCERQSPVKGLEVNPEFSEKTLTDNLVSRLRVKFTTNSSFEPPEKDYKLVAEADWQGRFLFKETLNLNPPTSKWLPGRVYEVEKYVYLPAFIDRFNAETAHGVRINFSLSFQKEGQNAPVILFERVFKVSPCPPDVPDVVYLDGWQKITRAWPASDQPLFDLWTQRQAICLLKNPGWTALLMIRGDCYVPDNGKQGVLLILDDRQLDQFELEGGSFEKIYFLNEKDLGQKPELILKITVDRTFKASRIYPEIKDDHEIGVKIGVIYFR
jgi:hypothetical protein